MLNRSSSLSLFLIRKILQTLNHLPAKWGLLHKLVNVQRVWLPPWGRFCARVCRTRGCGCRGTRRAVLRQEWLSKNRAGAGLPGEQISWGICADHSGVQERGWWWLWSLWALGLKVASFGLSYEVRKKFRWESAFQCMNETAKRRNLGGWTDETCEGNELTSSALLTGPGGK